jgi:hypothetical protein
MIIIYDIIIYVDILVTILSNLHSNQEIKLLN